MRGSCLNNALAAPDCVPNFFSEKSVPHAYVQRSSEYDSLPSNHCQRRRVNCSYTFIVTYLLCNGRNFGSFDTVLILEFRSSTQRGWPDHYVLPTPAAGLVASARTEFQGASTEPEGHSKAVESSPATVVALAKPEFFAMGEPSSGQATAVCGLAFLFIFAAAGVGITGVGYHERKHSTCNKQISGDVLAETFFPFPYELLQWLPKSGICTVDIFFTFAGADYNRTVTSLTDSCLALNGFFFFFFFFCLSRRPSHFASMTLQNIQRRN